MLQMPSHIVFLKTQMCDAQKALAKPLRKKLLFFFSFFTLLSLTSQFEPKLWRMTHSVHQQTQNICDSTEQTISHTVLFLHSAIQTLGHQKEMLRLF